MRTDRAYLGDGLYAEFDGYQIWLTTDRDGFTHEVALEPEVFSSLQDYWIKIHRRYPTVEKDNG